MMGLPEESTIYIVRILVAALLGALIGFERDIHGRAAGLRTHLLVSMGAAVFVILSESIASHWKGGAADPGRIAAQVVTGIGFLGAGAIIKEGLNIRGLTTAACLWTVAGIGMASGAGSYAVAVATTFIALGCLVGLKHLERLYPRDSYRNLTITTTNDIEGSQVVDAIKNKNLKILFFDFERNFDAGITTIRLSIRLFHKGITDRLFSGFIASLEQAKIPLKSIKWDHRG